MRSRSFHSVTAFVTCMLMLSGLASGCVSDPVVDNPANNPNSVEGLGNSIQSDTSSDATAQQVVTISGRTATVDGISLAEAWVAVADDATQQVVSETTSDQNGDFTITLTGEVGGYDVLAFYQDDDITLISWQSFSLSDEVQDYQFDLSLSEPPAMDENSDDGAAPPPYGSGCYRVYTPNYMCSWHVWYVATYWAGPWYCYALNGGVNWVGVGSC